MASDSLFQKIRPLIESESDVLYTPLRHCAVLMTAGPRCSPCTISSTCTTRNFSAGGRLSRRVTYGLSAKHASYLQASSQYTKQDLLRYFPALSPEQIEVIPSGVQAEKSPRPRPKMNLLRCAACLSVFFFFQHNYGRTRII